MPKRTRLNLQDIAQWHNLAQAAYLAARGKRGRPDVKAFFQQFDVSLQQIQDCILRGQLFDGHYRSFLIHDPKLRVIHAASFHDRVIHHALINQMKHSFETSWVESSYACRPNKGSHRAIKKAALLSSRHFVVVKLDVKAYFASIHHDRLLLLLDRIFKGSGAFGLIESVLRSFATERGLPIGALTSQYFANHYLDGFQRYLRADPKVRDELRYMDDVLIFCNNLADARLIARQACEWLAANRNLCLKPAIIQRTRIGVEFCGFKVSQGILKLGQRRKRRYKTQLADLMLEAQDDALHPLELQAKANQVKALCYPGNHQTWQLKQLEQLDRDWRHLSL